jgi:hypothetical protein
MAHRLKIVGKLHPFLERIGPTGATLVGFGAPMGRYFAKIACDPNGWLWFVGAESYAREDRSSEFAGYVDP